MDAPGKDIRDKSNKKVQYEHVQCTGGGPNMDWIRLHGLTIHSTPQEWFRAFLPNDRTHSEQHKFDTSLCTNINATMELGGTAIYKDYNKAFTPCKIEENIAVIMLNGLHPSPSIEMKL
jgi:hypothetical protein